MMTPEEIATTLIQPLWRGVPAAYKSKYRASIWQQFEDQIRSAAYTSRLGVWYDTICRKLDIEVRAADVPILTNTLQAGQDRAILACLRDETTFLVLLVRAVNEERKAAYATRDLFETEEDA